MKAVFFAEALRRAGIDKKKREAIFEKVRETGTCQGIDEVPEIIRNVFVVSSDLSAEQHVRMQASLQPFVDNSISKTINFPATATVEEVKKAYLLAWKLKCKGLTVYVTGSRETVVLEAGKKEENPEPYKPTDGNGFRHDPLIKQLTPDVSGKVATKEICSECGGVMYKGEGCMTCSQCGYSKCDV